MFLTQCARTLKRTEKKQKDEGQTPLNSHPPINGLVISELDWASRTGESQPYFPEADCVQTPDIASYIRILLGFNIMTSYTFKTK